MPLSGVTVLDLTRMLSGPFCTMLLADMGAEVIKIETLPEGDPIRKSGALRDGLSYYFATFNRNKKSITLNLKDEKGRELFEKLLMRSDVVIDNFRPGVLERLGLGRERRFGPQFWGVALDQNTLLAHFDLHRAGTAAAVGGPDLAGRLARQRNLGFGLLGATLAAQIVQQP